MAVAIWLLPQFLLLSALKWFGQVVPVPWILRVKPACPLHGNSEVVSRVVPPKYTQAGGRRCDILLSPLLSPAHLSTQVTTAQTFHDGSRSLQSHHLVVGVQERHSGPRCISSPCLPQPLRQVLLAPFWLRRSLLTERLSVTQAGFRD